MTDRELIESYIRSRDETAFAELVERHGPMVLAAARRMARDDADDVAQAVFLLLSQRAPQLRGHANLAGWLYQATRGCALNANRIRQRRLKHTASAGVIAMKQQTRTASADSFAAMSDALDRALARLREPQRQVIILRYLEGHSLEAVAGQLGLSVSAVAKRAERALDRLREIFAARGLDGSGAALAVMLQSQTPALTGAQNAALIKAGAGTVSASAGALAAATGAASLLMLKIAAVLVIAAAVIGTTAAVIHSQAASNQQAHQPPATTISAPIAVIPPAIMPPPTVEGSQQFAKLFFAALRARDVSHLAGLIDAPTPQEQLAKALQYIGQFRDVVYARFPQQLDSILNSMTTRTAGQQLISAVFDAAPPTMADLQRLSIKLTATNGRLVLESMTYTSTQAVTESQPNAQSPATQPANSHIAPGTYTKALQAWQEFVGSMANMGNLNEANKPQMLVSLGEMPVSFRKFAALLQDTDLVIPQATVDDLCAVLKDMHDVLEQQGVDAMQAKVKTFNKSPAAKEFGELNALRSTLVTRAGAESDAIHTGPRPPSFAPSTEVTLAWDGSKFSINGPVAMPSWLRESESYKQWQKRHDVQMLQTTDDDGFSYKVFLGGAVKDKEGKEHEFISAIQRYRKDGTLAAFANYQPMGTPIEWAELDATGLKYIWHADATDDPQGRSFIRRVVFFDSAGNQRVWHVFATGFVETESSEDPIGQNSRITHLREAEAASKPSPGKK